MGKGLRYELILRAYGPDGKLIGERREDGDVFTYNFIHYVLQGALCARQEKEGLTVSLTGEDGTSYNGKDRDISVQPSRCKIAIGTGTTSPSPSDYALENKQAESEEVSVNIDTANKVNAYSVSITLENAMDITEAGFFYYDEYNNHWLLLIRDTFNAVSVPAGGTIGVTFKIYWG